MIQIRPYRQGEEIKIREVFFHSVRNVCIQHYSQQQVEAWAVESYDADKLMAMCKHNQPFVAIIENEIVGYSDLQDDGLIDQFFCHWQVQRQGVGQALMNHIFELAEARGIDRIHSLVSITARPFFERMGFHVVRDNEVEVRGVSLNNFVMEKVS
ncbi:GNAT family N-acetyltransferase [Veronia nyctiphanis]|uniref:GNAT family N-acetyltransferase n=1 Tax=Veronia nyctiphanis TaxID=1278244 RepID=A0A4Q0YPU7_9GAMM|nr:GNAT family N-acetyltransferase [Veronia nyctiphanis]RXJ71855.1 GNAT family N-acetyltransferase [Veronia nyctiphanis]RXJ72603.1 GNAT family N-acetyltransferase [Veronia nyctiphanis]